MWPQNNWEWLSCAWVLFSLGLFAWWWFVLRRAVKRRGPNDSAAQQMRVQRRA
jgi:hypothetical protein